MKNPARLTPSAYLDRLAHTFLEAGDPGRAIQQRRYMRDQFDYYGLGAPEWQALTKNMIAEEGVFTGNDLMAYARMCFAREYRELHYAAILMLERQLKYQPASWIDFLEEAVLTNSWWDTVDWLAKLIGQHFRRYPDLQFPRCRAWIDGSGMWLQRVAIIHQLAYKEHTDEQLLFALIRRQAANPEFFIRKACGWALRQYAKTHPARVEEFLHRETLSPLTVREARKELDRRKR